MRTGRAAAAIGFARRAGMAIAALTIGFVGSVQGTQDAVANGDTRSLTLYHNHTKESATITFRRNGQYDPRGLEQLNWMLRDWRRDEPTQMDPRLFDTLWEVYREVGSNEPIHINSAYRSPHTNAMLRRRSSAVAKSSQHMRGKAIDFYLPDVPIERIRAVGMRLQNGGVGFYPNAYTPFVHLDVGSVRAWPRMTRDQLVRLFPDGKTVHVPADGDPLPGYEEARAEVLARGFSVGGVTTVAEGEGGGVAAPKRKSFWATLFGGSDEDEDAEEIRTARSGRSTYVARRAPPANLYGDDQSSSIYAALQPPAPVSQPARQVARAMPQPDVAERDAVATRPESTPVSLPAPTRIAGLPSSVETPAGPKLVWQQGGGGQALTISPASREMLTELALAPLPPRRPDDVVTTGTLAFAPMPPARPGAITGATMLLAAGAPNLRDATALAPGHVVDHPLPPPRPVVPTVAVASLGAIPLGPTAPAAPLVRTGSKAPVDGVPAAAPKDERAQIRSLFSNAAEPVFTPSSVATAKTRMQPAAIPSGMVAQAGPNLAMGFSSKPAGDLAANRFTGPAVRPLAVVR